jgi:hypothetical protein
MGHAFHELFYHFAWSTHSRVALIRRDYRPGLLKIINEETKQVVNVIGENCGRRGLSRSGDFAP